MRRTLSLCLMAVGSVASLNGQSPPVGEMTVAMRFKLPPSASGRMPLGQVPELRIRFGSDGHRILYGISAAGTGTDPVSAMLASAWLKVVSRPAGDSVDIAVAIPEQFRAMLAPNAGAAAPEGYRVTVPIVRLDSLRNGFGLDSLKAAMKKLPVTPDTAMPKFDLKRTGAHETIAGLSCEVWNLTVDTVRVSTCMTREVPFMSGIREYVTAKLGLAGFADSLQAYLGQNAAANPLKELKGLTPLRVVVGDSLAVFQALSVSASAPPDTEFAIPAAFKLLDLKSLAADAKAKLGGTPPWQP